MDTEENGSRKCWERWADQVNEHCCGGNRMTMLQLPHVKGVAEILEQEMDRVAGKVLSQHG